MKTKLFALAALSLFASLAHAQAYDETRCRSSSSVYSAHWYEQATASGFYGDYVIILDRYGNVRFAQTVGWCVNHQGGVVAGIVANSGGQTSVRLNLSALGNLSGGVYAVVRDSVIDMDAITG